MVYVFTEILEKSISKVLLVDTNAILVKFRTTQENNYNSVRYYMFFFPNIMIYTFTSFY